MEYEQCMESYRHTYQTIWQAGTVLVTASAAIVALAASRGGVDPIAQVIAPVPFLFWWWGIFRPMNRYGERRSKRLAELEKRLNTLVAGLDMGHFIDYDAERKSVGFLRRTARLKWLWQPRVSEVVNLIGIALLGVEGGLIWIHYLS